jgi:hypothetical protein
MKSAEYEYFREKIERELQFYERGADLIDAKYVAEVEKLAKRTPDKQLAQFFLETVNPDRIKAEIAHIRAILQHSRVVEAQIVEADRELELLKSNIHAVEERLRRRFFIAGLKRSVGGQKGSATRWGPPDARSRRDDEMRKMFNAKRAAGLSIGRAESAVASAFRITARTVRSVVRTEK